MTSLNDSIVHVPFGELKKLEEALVTARARIVELEARPLTLAAEVANVEITRLGTALGLAVDALGVYTVRISPYEVKGLPARKLRELATALEILYGFVDQVDTLRELCNEIEACEMKRAANPKPIHMATGEDWQVGREAFEREFGVDPSTYRDGGLAGVLKARAAKEAAARPQAGEHDPPLAEVDAAFDATDDDGSKPK